MVISPDYVNKIEAIFKFSEKQSFCQIATVSKQEDVYTPKLRTVLLYHEKERNAFRFTCSTQTHKWAELKNTPKVTGIYFDRENFTQYRFEADAILIDRNTNDEKEFHTNTWENLRPDLRHVLWQEYLNNPEETYNIKKIFPHHGNVILKPYYWDIFTLNIQDYVESQRTQMILIDNEWRIYENAPKICPLELTINKTVA